MCSLRRRQEAAPQSHGTLEIGTNQRKVKEVREQRGASSRL